MWLELLTLSNEITLFYHNLEMNYLNNGPFGLEKLSINVLIQFTSVHIITMTKLFMGKNRIRQSHPADIIRSFLV